MSDGGKDGVGSRPGERPRLAHVMLMIAGVGFGLWLGLPDLRENGASVEAWWVGATLVLGGLSMVGVPLLLAERRSMRRPWNGGRLLWFAQGTATWLMWPPIVPKRLSGGDLGDASTGVCYVYGTPLMALYVTIALVAGKRLGCRRRRGRRDWKERFGLILGLAWACTGLYVLGKLYLEDLN